VDLDGIGDACDPLDGRDPDGDGIPTGPQAGDPLYPAAVAAKNRWSLGTTHFVIRIDALGRFFQNEFTQLLTDAGSLSPSEWRRSAGRITTPATSARSGLRAVRHRDAGAGTHAGGRPEIPISLVLIQADLERSSVVTWMNDRNDSARLELALHGTYHVNNTPLSDWAGLPDRNWISCEWCGLTEAESFEFAKVGYDTFAETTRTPG